MTVLTAALLQQIESTGIIPSEVLDAYLDGKNLEKPEQSLYQAAKEEERVETMYKQYRANMQAAQKAANAQLQGRKK